MTNSEPLSPRPAPSSTFSRLAQAAQWSGLILGPVLGLLVYTSIGGPSDPAMPALTESGKRVIALAVVMATWWLTETIPVSITALLPVAVLPLLDVGTIQSAAAPYADKVLFLFLGGFIIGEALRQSGLHRRLALLTLLAVGASPARMVGGIMLATGFISMWVSNTATTIMMLPIGLSMVALVEARSRLPGASESGWTAAAVRNFGAAIVLGIAYAASIGGIGTPVGSPPNLIMLNYVQHALHRDIGFGQWMLVGMPIVAVFLPAAWLLLTRWLHPVRAGEVPGGRTMLRDELSRLGPVSRAERATLAVFLFAAAAWIFRKFIADAIGRPLTDEGIAVIAAISLFVIPIGVRPRRAVIEYQHVESLPWGILLLFGGGLSIAAAMSREGVDIYLGSLFAGLSHLPMPLLVLILVSAVTFIGELTSNAAVVTALMPVLGAAAVGMGVDPIPLMLAATLGSSCGFMLPVATPPNALAYATKRITQGQMIRTGVLLDIVGIAIVTAAVVIGARYLAPASAPEAPTPPRLPASSAPG